MTSVPPTNGAVRSRPRLRLRLKPNTSATGHVDGAWWPRSRCVTTELAALAEALAGRLGRVERVAYALSSWDDAPRRFRLSGHLARLEGFTYQDRNVVHLTGANHGRVTLLVVPPEMTAVAGRAAMMTAAHGGNADRPEEILAAAIVPVPRRERRPTQQGEVR
ncbi:DUF5994 family protein [Actinophytocola glycyrrhizae]|uniref:DUF5994 family protein n=1 Tax=Actinophytocola glycyrrhizae TaxID=2044873 RepID=A0ABV9SBI6_9PSEU